MTKLTRKRFLSGSAAGAASLFGANLPAAAAQRQNSGRPPNVLFIMADQHKPGGLGIEGDPVARTPNLDALARRSVRFDAAYCSNPVCLPARASLLTGLYSHNHTAFNNRTAWPFSKKTMAHHFSRAGYMTALCGKMHFSDAQTHGFDYKIEFNDWFQQLGPKTKIFAEELGRSNDGSGLPQLPSLWADFGDPWEGVRQKDGRKGLNVPGGVSKFAEQEHFENFLTRESLRFLKNHGKAQPFFLVTSYLKPHSPFLPADRFARMFRPEQMKPHHTFGKVDRNSVPKEIRDRIDHFPICPELADPEQAKLHIASYWASVAQVDENVGRLLKGLAELGLENDTIVIYTADHGDMLGEHGLWDKYVFYEQSVRVPLLFHIPGMSNGNTVSKTPVSHVQMLPTLLDLCGLSVPSGLDGDSFAAAIREPLRARDAAVYSEFALRTEKARYMIRQGDFKYSYYVGDMAELYNLRDDPQEMRNLALNPQHRDRVQQMHAQLLAWYKPPEGNTGAAAR